MILDPSLAWSCCTGHTLISKIFSNIQFPQPKAELQKEGLVVPVREDPW